MIERGESGVDVTTFVADVATKVGTLDRDPSD
jgi:hypothetical protein